jgi:hypothetical protein
MFNSLVGKSNKSMMGGVTGLLTGAFRFSASTNSKPRISLPLLYEVGYVTGAATGASTGALTGTLNGAFIEVRA